jgi:hypothetical protein
VAQLGRQEWVTVIVCISVAGTEIEPYVIFKDANLISSWLPANLVGEYASLYDSAIRASTILKVTARRRLQFELLTENSPHSLTGYEPGLAQAPAVNSSGTYALSSIDYSVQINVQSHGQPIRQSS